MLGLSALSVPPEEDDWRSRMCFASYTVDGRAGARNAHHHQDGHDQRGRDLPMALEDLQVVKGLHESLPGTWVRSGSSLGETTRAGEWASEIMRRAASSSR